MKPSTALRALLAGATAATLPLVLAAPADAAPSPTAVVQEATRTVRVTQARRASIDRSVELVGTVLPWQSTTLMSRVTGYVTKVEVMPGDRVEQGALLCTLDLPALRAERQVARAGVAEAEALVKGKRGDIAAARADVLDAEAVEGVARSQITVREAAVEVADADARLAQAVLDRKRALREVKAATEEEVEEAQGRLDSTRAMRAAAAADVTMAGAQLDAARARTQAALALVEAAEAQVAGAEAAVETARAALELVTTRLRFGELRSPYDNALVTDRYIDAGALAEANETELLTIMDVSKVRLQIHVPERISRTVHKSTRVVIEMDDAEGTPIEAGVARVAGALATRSRTMAVEVDLDNTAGSFYPGMFFHARVSVETLEDALLLPGSAVHTARKQNYVLVVDDQGLVQRKDVKLGVDDGRIVQIISGLTGEERVVVALVAGLREGDRVRAVGDEP